MSLIVCKLREQVATLKEDLRHEIANAQWEANRANDALEQAATDRARVKELEEAQKRLEQKISYQRHEIKNRLIEILNLAGFKRNIESYIAARTPAEFKRRPFGGIAWLVDRHTTQSGTDVAEQNGASPNQDDVAEQSMESREFMGGTK